MKPFVLDILIELEERGYTYIYDIDTHTLTVETAYGWAVIDWIDKMARNIRRGLISFNEAVREIIRYIND